MSQKTDLATLLEEMRDPEAIIRATLIYQLSNPNPADFATFQNMWPTLPDEQRERIMQRVMEASETSFEMNFTAVATLALDDPDDNVRQHAIETLWFQSDLPLIQKLIKMLQTDSSPEVRAKTASSLGRFIFEGEIEELPAATLQEVEEALLPVYQNKDNDLDIRRRALEALAYSSRKEIEGYIREAHQHENLKMRVSAIFAMGRQGDDQWEKPVMDALESDEPEIRFEAVRATGEMLLLDAIPHLEELVYETDREIKEMAIWSLGEIGGSEATKILLKLSDEESDKVLMQVIEDALNMAALASGEFTSFILDDDDWDDDDI